MTAAATRDRGRRPRLLRRRARRGPRRRPRRAGRRRAGRDRPRPRRSSRRSAAAATPSYGISTGFGALATRHIPTEMRAQLQKSLVRSHAAGSGPEVEREVTRALMLLRLSTLATGHTGVRPVVAQTMAGDAQPRHHPGGARVRLARLLRRPRAAVALRARADGRGRGHRRPRRTPPRRRRAHRGRPRAGRAGGQGGPGADQRHRRHARHAGDGDRRTCGCCSRPPTSPPR